MAPTEGRVAKSEWIGLCSVLRPRQHSIGYTGDGFHRSKDPTNSIKVLKEMLQRKIRQSKQQSTHMHTNIKHNKSPSLHEYGVTRGRLPQRAQYPPMGWGEARGVQSSWNPVML